MNVSALRFAYPIIFLICGCGCDSKKKTSHAPDSGVDANATNRVEPLAAESGATGATARLLRQIGMTEDELVYGLVGQRSVEKWEKAVKSASEEEKLEMFLVAYRLMKKRGVYWPDSIAYIVSKFPPSLAGEFFEDFRQAPQEVLLPKEQMAWLATENAMRTPKYRLANAVVAIGEPEVLEKMWEDFPAMSETDQRFIAMVVGSLENMDQVQSIVAALPSAKSEGVTELLQAAASQLVYYGLESPDKHRVEVAAQLKVDLEKRGLARDFLMKKKR